MQHGETIDLRTIPSVVGGNEDSRHGIVLAKSIPAKKYNIQTGETLYSARKKYPELVIVPPRYRVYMNCSKVMFEILREYSPSVQRFSIDEGFLDYTNMGKHFSDPISAAHTIKNRINHELGFTVNIGISSNKLLAKMAGDLLKPDKVHTIYPEEISTKMWPLPVEDLFMVGPATAPKLHRLGIKTIGDLAKYDVNLLKMKLNSLGKLIWSYANGIEASKVREQPIWVKGIGNSTTTPFNVEDEKTAYLFILSLTETVASRLRDSGLCCGLVAVSIRNKDFLFYSRQRKFNYPTDSTDEIYCIAKELFKEVWKGEVIRHLGVRVSELSLGNNVQMALFTKRDLVKMKAIDTTIDKVRAKHGFNAITRASFTLSGIPAFSGGIGEDDYPMMSSIL